MGDLFVLQNEITRRIAAALDLTLIDAEAGRPADHPDALDYILRGRAALNKGATPDNYVQAIDLFEHALVIDPGSVEVQNWLALALLSRVLGGMSNSRTADTARAETLVWQTLAISPRSTFAHSNKGKVLRAKGRCDEAIPEFEIVIASNPNAAYALFSLGVCKLWTGSIDETIPLEEQAIRLSPRDPYISGRYQVIGEVHLLQSRTKEAIVWLERARAGNPGLPIPHAWLASAYALKGDLDRAAAELAEARKLRGDPRPWSIAGLRVRYQDRTIRALAEATLVTGLRKAGMPEE
jgi:adenylate cyclase